MYKLKHMGRTFIVDKDSEIEAVNKLKDAAKYGLTPLFKWNKGNKKPERIEYSLESARYTKYALEKEDHIPYVLFDLTTYQIIN